MEEKNFSPEESLRVIHTMIDRTKRNIAQDAFHYLLWGWLCVIAALGEYILMVWIKYPKHWMVWNLMWVGAIIAFVYSMRTERKAKVKTYMSHVGKYIGIGTGVTCMLMSFVISYEQIWYTGFSFYFLVTGLVAFITGGIIQFRSLVFGAIICWVSAIAGLFLPKFEHRLLLMAFVFVCVYLIPGYTMKQSNAKM